jgi:DNA replication protein DnaC
MRSSLSVNGPFIQVETGGILAYEFGEAFPTFSAGTSLGWRHAVSRNWYVKPAVRLGYPHIWGLDITAGYRFRIKERNNKNYEIEKLVEIEEQKNELKKSIEESQLLFNSLEAASNIVSAGAADFENFDESLFSDSADEKKYRQAASPRENIRRIRDSAGRFIKAFLGGAHENLYFFGKSGTGKTFMAAAIANELMRNGVPVLYLSAPTLFNIMTEHRMVSLRADEYRDTLYRQIFTCKLLIIDDLGTEAMTDSRYSEFISLLNERLVPGMYSTIISTNMEIRKLQNIYDEPILSRIAGYFRIIYFYGDDLRLRREKNAGRNSNT